jgi:hypothetical protein
MLVGWPPRKAPSGGGGGGGGGPGAQEARAIMGQASQVDPLLERPSCQGGH